MGAFCLKYAHLKMVCCNEVSILNITLFAVAINNVISVLPEGVRACLYLHDLSISFSSARVPLIKRKLQIGINRIFRWTEMRGFRFSALKNVAMHFCRLRSVYSDPDLYVFIS